MSNWMDDAACIGIDPELFFPITYGNQYSHLDHSGPAVAICDTCDVRRQCLDMAIDDPSLVGIWGGTTPEQRRRIRRLRHGPNLTTIKGERDR